MSKPSVADSVSAKHTPGVLHNPEVFAALIAVANHQHAMIKSSATFRIKDAALVQLELALIRLDGHADWLVSYCLRPSSCMSSPVKGQRVACTAPRHRYSCRLYT